MRYSTTAFMILAMLVLAGCIQALTPSWATPVPSHTIIGTDQTASGVDPNFATPTSTGFSSTRVTSTDSSPTFTEPSSGDYVLYFTRALYVVPEGGGDPIRYSDVIGLPLYPDMNEIFTGSAIYNLTNHSYHNIASHANFQDCGVYSGSIDQNNYTLKCCDGNLYVASTDEETKTRINLRSSDSDRFEGPIWSPDGEWISYLRTIPDPNDYSSEGKAQLFLVKTDCLSDPGSCPLLTRGPIEGDFFVGTAPYGWSPDSRYLAIPSMSATSILIYDLQTNTIRRILWETGVYSVAWSPDGAWLAFSGYASSNQAALAIYVMPESGGQARLLVSDIEDTTILYWMRAP